MGYRDDGNFGITGSADALTPGSERSQDNPKFIYPSNRIRFLEAQAALDKNPQSYKLHRGYIRNLKLPTLSSTKIFRCGFQFNPQTISQNVQMREDMYLAILQDPAQLAQPIGASMNFSFDLMFDRSLEVSAPVSANIANIANDEGVHADLKILYTIIGQGFNTDLLENQVDQTIAGATRIFENTTTGASTTVIPSDGTTNGSGFTTDREQAKTILASNRGNAAILMPNPVRIMFSGMFMVDGFITGTSVDFLKFTTNMVPVQCRVTLSMNAVYIGFAREDTFLTLQFDAAIKTLEDNKKTSEAENPAIIKALNKSANKIQMGYAEDNSNMGNFMSRAHPIHKQTGSQNWNDRNFFLKFASIIPHGNSTLSNAWDMTWGSVEKSVVATVNIVPGTPLGEFDITSGDGKSDEDEILKLYEQSMNLKINYKFTFQIYGVKDATLPLSTATNFLSLISAEGGVEPGDSLKMLGSYTGENGSVSKKEWGAGQSGDGASASKARRWSVKSPDDVPNTNNAPDVASGDDDDKNLLPSGSSSYCIVRWTFDISVQKDDNDIIYPKLATAEVPDATSITCNIVNNSTIEIIAIVNANSDSNVTLTIDWGN
jgi:hypothetical protein